MTLSSAAPESTKRTRRGLSKNKRAARIATHEEMPIDGDDELQENNRVGIVSILEENQGSSSSSFPTSAAQAEAALAAIDEHENIEDDEMVLDVTVPAEIPGKSAEAAAFKPLSVSAQATTLRSEMRRIAIPPHRMTPLKKDWVNIFVPLTEMAGLQVRMNVHRRCVEMRVSPTIIYRPSEGLM
jgi:RNA-binding protein PNO1